MPHKTKKFIKRKKTRVSSSFPKSKSKKGDKYQDIVVISGVANEKRPSASCRTRASSSFPKSNSNEGDEYRDIVVISGVANEKRTSASYRTRASSSFPKSKSNEEDKYQDIVVISGVANEKRTSASCRKSVGLAGGCDNGVVKLNRSPIIRFDDPTASRASNDKCCCKSCRLANKKKLFNKEYDSGGVKRLFSPFNRFARTPDKNIFFKMPYKSQYRQMGLSPKEKSYVICSCQARSSRYIKLKKLAANAIKTNKIFTVYGNCNAVRKALLERGWIEKIAPTKMNLSRIRNGTFSNKNDVHNELERLLLSNLVEKHSPNFIWRTKEQHETTIDMTKEFTAIVNKLKIDALWTSKQAEVNGPRSYNIYDSGELEEFVKDFRISACTSLLKWILSMVANERPVFMDRGKISMNVIVFALNRCKEYLFRKQNKDIDHTWYTATTGQWNAFIKKYYRIISKDDVFKSDKDNKLSLYLSYAKFLLKEIHKYRPQLSCEGCHNIWIIKPAHCSRGRGIRLASKLAIIMNLLNKANSKYVIQKYIEEPLLIHETKFDIRQYYLVVSTYPLVIWMYKECYLKFSSQKYSLKKYDESIHLTNNAVQRKYKNCTGRHADLPQSNMWDLDRYKDYLNRIGLDKVWDNVIYPGMKKSIIGIMLSCQDSLSVCKNRFELYGCDFILDREYKPWLIEINSCPDLNATTHVTAKICPAVVSDIIKVVIDYAGDSKSPTGKFECIYRQPMTMPKYGGAADLFVRGFALGNEYFYKGNIEIKDSYDAANIGKESDMNSVLNKLKNIYETDIMVEPEDDSDFSLMKETCVQNTESEYELSVAATVVTDQIDELMERITSEHTDSTNSISTQEFTYNNVHSTGNISQSQTAKSEMDIKSLVKRSGSRFTSAEAVNILQSYRFSRLDDGPSTKQSLFEFNSLR